jgi:membrane fusion protein, macrolide-specific efflux system
MNTKKKLLVILSVIVVIAAVAFVKLKPKADNGETTGEITPRIGPIQTTISSTGTVLPKNRLQIKPPVNGRIESLLVKEGDMVKKGQTLGWLSSTERAALLDAAQGQGEDKLKYWQEVYKPIALVAPIDGEVIVATIQPGQTVTTSDAALVLSDRLIVRAQVDETDIGKIKEGQHAIISLDAYSDTKIKATVDHIYHESQTVNNVTIYPVDLAPEEVPAFFRSGMNANVDFITESRENALLLSVGAVHNENGESYVLTRSADGKELTKRPVTTGMTDGKKVEITAGLTADDTVVVQSEKYALPKAAAVGKNPFLPSRKQSTSSKRQDGGGPPP